MAFNNFDSVTIDANGTLIAEGLTLKNAPSALQPNPPKVPAGVPGQKIDVVIVSCDPKQGKRCDPTVADPEDSGWSAKCKAAEHSFSKNDEVYVIGEADAPGEPLEVWCQKFTIGPPA